MSDRRNAVAQAFAVMGLKVRDAATVLSTLESQHQCKVSDEGGFLSIEQNGQQVNIPTILQAYLKQHPADFVGHVGEVRYKSDVPDDKAKVALIREKGIDWWAALPATKDSPTAKDVVKPVIASTQMKRSEWLQLTPKEKTAAIASWEDKAIAIVQEINARR